MVWVYPVNSSTTDDSNGHIDLRVSDQRLIAAYRYPERHGGDQGTALVRCQMAHP